MIVIAAVSFLALSSVCSPPTHQSGALQLRDGAVAVPSAFRVPAANSVPTPLAGWYKLPANGSPILNRTAFTMAYDGQDGDPVLFGGCVSNGTFISLEGCASPSNQTWQFENGTWVQLHPKVSPSGRYFAMMTNDPAAGGLLLFGGDNGSSLLNDTWAYSGGDWEELHPSTAPPGLEEAAIGYDAGSSEAVLFGGLVAGALDASYGTWVFANDDWTNVTTTSHPPGWISPAMAADAQGGVVMHGGINALFFPTYYQQTWTYGVNGWLNVTSESGAQPPPAVLYSIAVFDPTRNETLVFGGGDSTDIPAATWAYNASGTWTQVLSGDVGPDGGFYETGAAFDSHNNLTIEFGEEGLGSFYGIPTINSLTNSTWALVSTLETDGITGNLSALVGTNQTFSASAFGGLPPYQFNWSFGPNATSNASKPVVTFQASGEHWVNLTLSDAVGQIVSASLLVNATAKSTASQGLSRTLGFSDWYLVGAGAAVAIVAAAVAVLLLRRKRKRESGVPPGSSPAIPESPPIGPSPPPPT